MGWYALKKAKPGTPCRMLDLYQRAFFFLNAALDIIGVFEELSVNLKIIKNPDVLISVFEHACLLQTTHIKTITRNYFIKERKKSFLTKLS